MKKFFILFIISVFSVQLFASTTIKGTILDATSQNPLEFVNVTIMKKGSKIPLAGMSSDTKGSFLFTNISNGNYIIQFSFVGYNALDKEVNVTDSPLNLGIIKLEEDSKSLSEVEVVGQGSQMRFEIDKKVFSVDQNLAAAGGSASDVLKNIPSVTVDIQGNVSLRKDGNVEVWINGKASGLTADNRAQVLQQMPAENIESIEIMTNPSAKYNPEGSAGIINIVLKKQRKAGYYGSVSAGVIYPDGADLGSNVGASINYSSSKVDAYFNVGYRAMSFMGGSSTNRYNYLANDTTLLQQDGTSLLAFSGVFLRTGIDYHLDDKNTLSLSGFGMTGSGIQNSNTDYLLSNYTQNSNAVLRDYNRIINSTGSRPSLNINLDYKLDFDKESNLMASLGYSSHMRGNYSNYIDSMATYVTNLNQDMVGKFKTWELKVDYTKKYNENSKLEAGWQSNLVNRLSTSTGFDNKTQLPINEYFDNFRYYEQIHAGYLTYGNKFDKFTIQGGLRAELYTRNFSDTTFIANTQNKTVKDYNTTPIFHVFPSLYLSYSLPNESELQFNYTNRVNRSRGRQINPYRNYSDSTNISYGNPYLKPEYISSFELNYIKSWGAQTLSGSLYYKFTDDVVQSVRFLNNGVMESTYANIAKSQYTGLELISKNRLFEILSLTTSLNLYYNTLDSATYVNKSVQPETSTFIPGQSKFSYSGNIMANFMLSKNFSGQITAQYNSPQLIAQGVENASYSIDMGFRQMLFNKKLSINVMVRDLLNSDRRNSISSGSGFYQTSTSYFHGRMLGLTLTYNFGNMQPKKTDMKKGNSSMDMNMDGGMD